MSLYKTLISGAICVWLPIFAQASDGVDYTKGVFIVNEDWYGHQNSTVNYLLPDDPDGNWWHYRVIQTENPGVELGCTNQYGAIWNGRFYLIAKQAKDPGASVTGGRISIADAATMKMIKQLELIDPSGNQCDGRAFVGVSDTKGYVSSSNGVWVLDLTTLDITGQVEGTANPNVSGGDKPASNPGSSLYFGQTGSMALAEGRVFAVHQQYGVLVIDPETDKVTDVIDMTAVDDAVERDTGVRPSKPSGIGSAIVRSKDGDLWMNVAKNVQGSGDALPYLLRIDPSTLENEVVPVTGDGIYPPSNSWYAWTPDPFCASSVTNSLYWCGGASSWFTGREIFRYDIDTRSARKIVDLATQPGNWSVYGCSLGIHPVTDELYASLYHDFSNNTYIMRRFDNNGNQIRDYEMIANYWFPSLLVFPQSDGGAGIEMPVSDRIGSVSVADGRIVLHGFAGCDAAVYTMSGQCVYRMPVTDGMQQIPANLSTGIYIVRVGNTVSKVAI